MVGRCRALPLVSKEARVSTESQLRGYLLEEALAWLLRNAGYRLLVHESQDKEELKQNGNGLCVKGRGAEHQVDVLGEFAFTPAFSFPIRLFLEAKFTSRKTDLKAVRNAHGIVHDINENFVHGPGQRLRKRFRYVYALFSAKGFTKEAQDFALAQQISLVDLSGASFSWLRAAVENAAADLYRIQETHRARQFPVNWARGQARRLLHTMPELPFEMDPYPETAASRFAEAAYDVLTAFSASLLGRQHNELLLGFPSAPFVLPLATDDIEGFLAYSTAKPEHRIQLRRTDHSNMAEWMVSPADTPWDDYPAARADLFFPHETEGYTLTFNLPDELQSCISQDEEYRISRTKAVQRQPLSHILIYPLEDDTLQTFQLRYEPGDLRRQPNQG